MENFNYIYKNEKSGLAFLKTYIRSNFLNALMIRMNLKFTTIRVFIMTLESSWNVLQTVFVLLI